MNEKSKKLKIEMLKDAELISRYLDGDERAFEELYERYKRQLFSYLHKLLSGNQSLCEEMFQQTWIRAIDNLFRYRDSEKFLAWLMRISHNLAMDHFRKFRREQIEDISESDWKENFSTSTTPERELAIKEMRELLDECISRLPLEQREVFLLRADDLAFKDIAEVQGCSINTALARMQYALKNLRNCIKSRRGAK